MFGRGKGLWLFVIAVLVCLFPIAASAEDGKLTGMVVGRSGELLHVSLPQPVEAGTVLCIKPIQSDPAIAEVRVVSCTEERPFIALAKVVKGDMETPVATGVRAYADVDDVSAKDAPRPMSRGGGGESRFSLQAGAFQPTTDSLKQSVAEVWQAYRLNYSLVKMNTFDALLSAEYSKGSGDFVSEAGSVSRSMEVIPLTLVGRIKPLRLGSMHLFLGAGAGYYQIRSEESGGAGLTSSTQREFGHEFTAGFESKRGWILELRYRDVPDTEIQGYSLGIGGRF